MKSLIAICGPKGAGKTTLANLLVENYNYTKFSFADPIKSLLTTLMLTQGADYAHVERCLRGDLKESPSNYLAGRTPRYAMQTLGAEWRDMIDRELWAKIWKNRVSTGYADKIVVDDLRFLHEEKAIREYDIPSLIIRLNRDGHHPGHHISEHEYLHIQCDDIIWNDGSPGNMLNSLVKYIEAE